MTILETVTVFVGVPAAVFAVIAALVYLSSVRPGRRYRPGRPYEFAPVWFLSAPGRLSMDGRQPARAELASGEEAGDHAAALAAESDTEVAAAESVSVKGGARGSW